MTSSRHQCRNGHPCDPRSLAEAIYCCLYHSGLDVAVIAERMGVRRSYLYDAANPDREDTQFQTRLLIPLMLVTGNYGPLRFLARQTGFVLLRLPEGGGEPGEINQHVLATIKEFGDVSNEIAESLKGDNRIDTGELSRIDGQFAELFEAAVSLQQAVHVKAGVPMEATA